ncbi:MAG: hypothetical protein WBQ21_03620 [Solirubrobacteraceae bacterium]
MKRTPEQSGDLPERSEGGSPAQLDANLPLPASERGAWLLAGGLVVLGVAALALVLSGTIGSVSSTNAAAPPPVIAVTPTPVPGVSQPPNQLANSAGHPGAHTGRSASHAHAHPIVGDPTPTQARRDLAVYETPTSTHISEAWMQGFYPIYAAAQRTFGVSWLLIASIHKQETDFSTAPTTYHGLNFAGCCGGPMQFNVTNGPTTTWALVSNSYIYGTRPASYDHMTATHSSIYDDFDSIMAAAHLLSADGAEMELDGAAWDAAYDYYGHDLTGVTYADQVLARAITWSQHGFCINCGLEPAMVQAVYEAYGAPVAAPYETATVARKIKPRRLGRSTRRPRGR